MSGKICKENEVNVKDVIIINYTGRHGSGNIHALVMAKELIEKHESLVQLR